MRPVKAKSPWATAVVLALLAALPVAAQAQSRNAPAGKSSHSVWDPGVYDLSGATAPVFSGTGVAPPKAAQPVERDGSASFQRSGDYSFTVPEYTSIAFMVNGAGGSAARPVTPIADNPVRYDPDFGTPGNDGSNSALWTLNLVGAGGGGGNGVTAVYKGGCYPKCKAPYPYDTIGNDSVTMTFYRGADGSASGGDLNTPGGAGNGGAPTESGGRNGGGNGGRAIKTFVKGQPGAPAPGTTVTMHVGAGGEPAVVTEPMKLKGMTTKPGGDGSVLINWKYLAN